MNIFAVVETEGPEFERRNILCGLFVTPEEAFECRKRFKESKAAMDEIGELLYGELVVLECRAGGGGVSEAGNHGEGVRRRAGDRRGHLPD